MGDLKYSIYQLMELAGESYSTNYDLGLSVAQSLYHYNQTEKGESDGKRILTICGPGNNGGDGLVAARHLKLFGHEPVIYYPKRTDKDIFRELVTQCENMEIKFLEDMPEDLNKDSYDYILDAIFGFSFKGELRSPFDTIVESMEKSGIPICSVDVPSGWNVDEGNVNNTFTPDMLVSLTAPKKCAKDFQGAHYLGGRFVPP